MYMIELLLESKSFCSTCWWFLSPDDVIIIHASVCVNNYFLNILPELTGLALFCHALYTALVISPLYIFVMYVRIKEEEKLLKEIIIPNGLREN